MTVERALPPLPTGQRYIDEDALDRMRFKKGDGLDGHDIAGANWNTIRRLVATIDYYRAAIAVAKTQDTA